MINPGFQPNFLTSFETKLDLLKDTGVDFVSAIKFDQDVADLTAKDFLRLLKNKLGMQGLVVGPDFQMGKNREADTVRLATLGSELGFDLEVVDVKKNGRNCGSEESLEAEKRPDAIFELREPSRSEIVGIREKNTYENSKKRRVQKI